MTFYDEKHHLTVLQLRFSHVRKKKKTPPHLQQMPSKWKPEWCLNPVKGQMKNYTSE